MGKKNKVRHLKKKGLCVASGLLLDLLVYYWGVYPRILPAVIANKEISLVSGEYLSLSDGR